MPSFRQVLLPAERTYSPPARSDLQGSRSASRQVTTRYRAPYGAAGDTADAAVPKCRWDVVLRADSEAREIIFPVQLVPHPMLFIVELLFHCLTLPFIIKASLALPPFCLLWFSGLCHQIVYLPAREYLPKEGIVLVLLPQRSVLLFEPVIAPSQTLVIHCREVPRRRDQQR